MRRALLLATAVGALVAVPNAAAGSFTGIAVAKDSKRKAAVVVTDGYTEPIAGAQVAATAGTRLHVILTRDGSAALLRHAGLPYTQLSRLPS